MPTDTLTPEAVLAMPAGEEMDRLVATKVLGWKCLVKELEREVATLRAERDAAVAEIARMLVALEPFERHLKRINESRKMANEHGWNWPYPVGDDESTEVRVEIVRRAADALNGGPR